MIRLLLALLLIAGPALAAGPDKGGAPHDDHGNIELSAEVAQSDTPASVGIEPEGSAPSRGAGDESRAASLQSWGQMHPDCAEWTDACFVCRRSANGLIGCSTAGIACTPTKPICRDALPATIPKLTPGQMPGQTPAPNFLPAPVAPGLNSLPPSQ